MKKKIIAIVLTTMMVAAMFGCGSSEKESSDNASSETNMSQTESSPQAKVKDAADIKICYSIKGKNAWLEELGKGCKEACEALGIPEPTIVYNEEQADAASQSQAIEDMIALEPDAIIVDPTQAEVIATALNKAVDQGIF